MSKMTCSSILAKCSGNVRAAVDENSQPISCSACPSGYSCNENHCCPSKGCYCLISFFAFLMLQFFAETVCNTNYDAGKFAFQGSHTPRYFYSKTANNCLLFTYYGALGNANNFENYNDCVKFCKAWKITNFTKKNSEFNFVPIQNDCM